MSTLLQILQRRERQAAQNVNAQFVEELGAGWCRVILRDTNVEVRAKRAISTPISAGQDVIISRPDGSGRSKNTGYTIIALASAQLDTSSQIVQTSTHTGATITSIDPDPAIIAAGDSVNITVRGLGFTTVPAFEVAPAYGDPGLTDSTAPVITDTAINLVVAASSGIAPGDYSLTIGTLRTEPSYFQIGAGSFPANSIWAMVYDASFNPVLLRLLLDLSVYASYDLFTGGDFAVLDVVKIGNDIYARSDHTMFRVPYPSGTPVTPTAGLFNGQGVKFGVWGTKIAYGVYDGSFLPNISLFETAGLTESAWTFSPTSGTPPVALVVDGDTAYFVDSLYVIAWSLLGSSVTDSISFSIGASPADPLCIAFDASHLYVASSVGLAKLTKSPLAVVSSSPSGTIGAFAAVNELRIVNGDLYATNQANQFLKIDTTTLTFTAVSIPNGPCGFAYSGGLHGNFYIGDVAGGVTVVDIDTLTNQGRTVVTGNDVRRLLYT